MTRARGQSPTSARPLLAELSDLVADLGMEPSGAAEPDPATAPSPPRAAAARPSRPAAPRRRPRRAIPHDDPWTALELALTEIAEARALSWPAPTLPLAPGEEPWSLLAAAAPIPAQERRRTRRRPFRRARGAVAGAFGRLRGGGLRTVVSAGALLVAVAVGLIGSDFLDHPLVHTGGPAEASVSQGMTLSDLRATAASSEVLAANAAAESDFAAPVNSVVLSATVGGGTRDGSVEFKVQRLAGPGEAVATEVADGLRTLAADGTNQVSFAVHGVGGPLQPGTYQVEVLHGERGLGSAQFTVSAAPQ